MATAIEAVTTPIAVHDTPSTVSESTQSPPCSCSRKDLDATERGDYGRMRGSSGGGAAHAPSLHQTACVRGLPLLAVLVLGCLLLVMLHPGIINSSSSRQWTHGTGTQNQATPARHIAKQDSPQGMCRYNYSVPNWAGQEVLPCDPAVCEGGDKLQPMATPLQKQRRWSPADEATYMDLYRSNRIEGWVNVSRQGLYTDHGRADMIMLVMGPPATFWSTGLATQHGRKHCRPHTDADQAQRARQGAAPSIMNTGAWSHVTVITCSFDQPSCSRQCATTWPVQKAAAA
jgi:hypothetical protein